MTLRTQSRRQQWMVWTCAVIIALVAYAVISRFMYGAVSWNVIAPLQQRIALPILAILYLLAIETRWDGVKREKAVKEKDEGEQRIAVAEEDVRNCTPSLEATPHQAQAQTLTLTSSATSSVSQGEELFNRARALLRQENPSYGRDDEYLSLLKKAADVGYAPAMAKFGKYAMHRGAWIEAYYWMKMAQRNGMCGLSVVLLKIRSKWARDGFDERSFKVDKFFTDEEAFLGRAFICIDSGHNTAAARKYLKDHHPELV